MPTKFWMIQRADSDQDYIELGFLSGLKYYSKEEAESVIRHKAKANPGIMYSLLESVEFVVN